MRTVSRWRWHLAEVFVKLNGVQHYLWRAVDHEGEVLESYVIKTRDKEAALRFLKMLMKRHGRPEEIVTDKLRSYGAALKNLGIQEKWVTSRWDNNRAEGIITGYRCSQLEERSVGLSSVPRLGFEPRNSGPVPRSRRGRAVGADPAGYLWQRSSGGLRDHHRVGKEETRTRLSVMG